MTYDASEISVDSGEPVELYTFNNQANVYRHTSHSENVTYLDAEYIAIPLSRSGIDQTQESSRNNITLTTSRDQAIAQLFRDRPPSDVVTLSIVRKHLTDVDDESAIIWTGRVLNIELTGMQANLHCEPIFTSIKRPGMRRHWQRSCPHVLYDVDCGVVKTDHQMTGTVSAVNNNVLTISEASAKPDGYFSGGFIKWQKVSGDVERRMIIAHTGNQLTMTFSMPGLSDAGVAQSVFLYPGCKHSMNECNTKYSNILNYGGQPWIPQKNPFNGTKIY